MFLIDDEIITRLRICLSMQGKIDVIINLGKRRNEQLEYRYEENEFLVDDEENIGERKLIGF